MAADSKCKLLKIFSATLIYIFLISVFAVGDDLFAQLKEPEFAVDYAQYKFPDKLILLEIYYSLSEESLTYKNVTNGYLAEGTIVTFLMNQIVDWENINSLGPDSLKLWIKTHKKVTLIDSIFVNNFLDSLNELSSAKQTNDMSMIKVNQGDYDLLTIFTDLNSKKVKVIRDCLYIRKYSKKKLSLSSLQLASSITPAKGEKTKFDKNGLRVIPNADRGYFLGDSRLFFCAEIYNLKIKEKALGSTYRVYYLIINQKGEVILKSSNASKKKPGTNAFINGSIYCGNFPCGFYKFKVKVTDEYSGKEAESDKNFYIYNRSK